MTRSPCGDALKNLRKQRSRSSEEVLVSFSNFLSSGCQRQVRILEHLRVRAVGDHERLNILRIVCVHLPLNDVGWRLFQQVDGPVLHSVLDNSLYLGS
jgi:hypothetical protein